jgi:UDP-3-O-[3-hydroxymyristoyl] glucosamine N-acyltransferase
VVDPSADISATAAIGAHVVIGADCKIGSSVRLWPGVVVSDGCSIGDGTEIFPNTTLYHNVHIGKSTRIHAGCVIGADGFGFEKTGPVGEWVRMAQTGGVRIGDHCDIGAGVTIDRGAIEDTVLGNNVILDNQIQVGHNCVLKDGTLMSGYTAIGGSTELGYHCLVGGGSLFAGHLKVADGTIITGGTSVSGSIKTRGIYSAGLPHAPNREWRKNIVRFRKLDEMYKRMVALEKKLDRLASEGPEDTPYD